MLWQGNDDLLEQNENIENDVLQSSEKETIHEKNELKIRTKLAEYRDPKDDLKRKALLAITERFDSLIIHNDLSEIDNQLMSEDCQLFISDSESHTVLKYSEKLGEGFMRVFNNQNMKINERLIIEVLVDVQKNTVMQTCKYLIWYEDEAKVGGGDLKEKVSCEIFTIKEHKICRYRALFALVTPEHGSNLFAPPAKDTMLAKIRSLNYLLADTPDFDRIASLLDDKVEYKIWTWEEGKCFVMRPDNLVQTFKQIQNEKKIIKIIPFEVKANSSKVVATYVYYLEDQMKEGAKRYMWISNCVYIFDDSLNIELISQIGELYLEDEIEIPFEAYTREAGEEYVMNIFRDKKPSFDMFYENLSSFATPLLRFGPLDAVSIGEFNGLKDKEELLIFTEENEKYTSEWSRPVDIYVDYHPSGYKIIFMTMNSQFLVKKTDEMGQRIVGNEVNVTKCYIEYCCSKLFSLASSVYERIPSPYQDESFRSHYVIPTKEYY